MSSSKEQFSSKAQEDFKLVDKAILGDEMAYTKLLQRYRNAVYHTILKMIRNVDDAEDLTIESFAKAFQNLDRFKKDFTFSTWLFRIATNNTIDFIRKKKLHTLSLENTIADEHGHSIPLNIEDESRLNPQDQAIREQRKEFILLFVNMLPPKYHRLVHLRYYQELSYDEISRKLNYPLGTIKAQLHRARELLYNLVREKIKHI